jgi:beta-mannosidase
MKISLNGRWQVREVPGQGRQPHVAGWLPAKVPGCVHTDLLAAKKIPDPYYRRNELDVLWVDSTGWEYVRTFRATRAQAAAALQQLVFEGLDTVAEVYLNGRQVGASANMFRRYRYDVAGVLREGANELRVVFQSPIEYGRRQHAKAPDLGGPIRYTEWENHPPRLSYRPYIRKAQYQFGWDWGPFLATSGIWQDCYLLAADEPVFQYVTTSQEHAPGRVTVNLTAHLLSPGRAAGVLHVKIGGQTVEVSATLKKGANRVAAGVTIANPRLWWPAGAGDQPLYKVKVEWLPKIATAKTTTTDCKQSVPHSASKCGTRSAASDSYETEIGLRKVELVQEKDAGGTSFKFRINGRDIYCKGADWIPDDVFPTRVTPDRVRFILASAVAANMNMIRVWGGGIYAEEEFLRQCDRLGLMVWHDFMFACATYPDDAAFLGNVEAEMRHQMRRMANHPSIVLWCGNNENQASVYHWQSSSPKQKRLARAYEKLTSGLQARVVAEEDAGRPWWPSSPHGVDGRMAMSYGNPDIGDMHYWEVWHARKPFANYLTVRPRFCSEFGFQSFPSVETLRTVAESEDFNVSSPVMEHHQRHRQGNSIITDFLSRHFRFPSDFGDFCYLSQVNHGLAMKTAVEHWRRLKPHCMGTLYWQLNDDWPGASWASIDWCLRWKALHYMARRFNAPLLASVTDDAEGLRLWATSDVAEPLKGRWTAEAWTFAGRRIWRGQGRLLLAADESRVVAKLPKEKIVDLAGGVDQVFIIVGLRSGQYHAENMHNLAPFKSVELPKARIRSTVRAARKNQFAVTLASDAPAFFVELSTGLVPGVFSDNILTLLQRRKVTLTFTPRQPTTLAALRKSLKVRSLRDTY